MIQGFCIRVKSVILNMDDVEGKRCLANYFVLCISAILASKNTLWWCSVVEGTRKDNIHKGGACRRG